MQDIRKILINYKNDDKNFMNFLGLHCIDTTRIIVIGKLSNRKPGSSSCSANNI